MGLDEIESGIRGKGQRQIDEIKAKSKEDFSKIDAECEIELRQRMGKMSSEHEKKKSALINGILSAARIQASNRISLEKAKIVDYALKSARDEVLNLPANEKRKILARMLEDKSMIDGAKTVFIEKKHAPLIPKSKDFEVKVQEIGDFGFLMKSKDGLVAIDNRLSKIIENMPEEIKIEVCEILFKET